MELRTDSCVIDLDERTGALVSLRAAHTPRQEFLISDHGDFPLFVVQYLDAQHALQELSSLDARRVSVQARSGAAGDEVICSYEHIGALDLSAVATIHTSPDDPAIFWRIAFTMPTDATITNVQYPYIVVSYAPDGDKDGSKLLQPFSNGRLHQRLRPHHFPPDFPDLWHLAPPNNEAAHYPGLTFAQFLAYYNQQAGLLLSCRDAAGHVKQIKPAHREPGLRLSLAHVVGWTTAGTHEISYDVALQGFAGDWYDAADIYRDWSLQQSWAATPLRERSDLPAWLAKAPLHIVMRIQGELDEGPTQTHPEFTPFENALPLLDRVAERIGGPLAPVIMSWERPGPWVYPDCFPPVGGADSLRYFSSAARERGWHIGTYCNGTRWATAHKWSGYRGEEFFRAQGGPESVCVQPDGRLWAARWDERWRPSYPGCIGTERTKELLRDYARTLLDLGLDWIQILDQNVGCCTFPCYADGHTHEPTPGHWMTAEMMALLNSIRERGDTSKREIAWSVESPCCEYFLPAFVICDIRPDFRTDFVPLYNYLYHEHIMTQAIFSAAPNPYFLVLKFARSFVLGEVLGCHMGAGGRLQNWEPPRGQPWMEWDRPAGDQEAAYDVLRNITALRQRIGADFLTFGRMLRPIPARDIKTIEWTLDAEANNVPAVETGTWQAPDGRIAVALANWTDQDQPVTVDLQGYEGRHIRLHLSAAGMVEEVAIDAPQDGLTPLTLPPHACALLVLSGTDSAGGNDAIHPDALRRRSPTPSMGSAS